MCYTGSCPYEYGAGDICRKPRGVECWLESDCEDTEEYLDRIEAEWEAAQLEKAEAY